MKIINSKAYLPLIFIFLLQGCVSTDILSEKNLPQQMREIVIKIQNKAQTACVTGVLDRDSEKISGGGVKISTKVFVRRLYTSEVGWFKVEATMNGVHDNVFYSIDSGVIVCGQKNWNAYADTNKIQFTEYGLNPKLLISKDSVNTRKITSEPKTDMRSIAVSWDGYSSLIAGEVLLAESAPGIGKMKIVLPKGDGTCSGQSKAINLKTGTGVWSVSCTNGMSAAGTYEAFGNGRGSTGTGNDSNGREVRYTVGARP